MAILYVETNFPLCIAKGQDTNADRLLADSLAGSLIMPSVCCMEALSVLGFEQRRYPQFAASFDRFLDDAGRDATSPDALSLKRHLEESRTAGAKRLNDIQDRLYNALERLSVIGDLIPLTPEAIRETLRNPRLEDPPDDLILASLLGHAATCPDPDRGFLSGNTRDFEDQPPVRDALRHSGIKYFRDARSAHGWLKSKQQSDH